MKQLLATIVCLVILGCGGSSPTSSIISTPPAQAQNLSLTNMSAIVGPMDVVNATCSTNGLTAKVNHIVPNSPSPGQAGVSLASDICGAGNLTIAHSFPASAANDGTYAVVAHNPGYIGATITCANCVTYDDEPGQLPPHNNCNPGTCSLTGDFFPVIVTDGAGITHVMFIRGVGAQGFNPHSFYEMTTTDGVTFTNPSMIATDTSMSCTQGGFASNCSYWSIMGGKLPNGNVIAVIELFDWNNSLDTAVYWYIYNIGTHTWSAKGLLPGTAPDSTPWVAEYGRFFINGTSACAGMFNSKSDFSEAWYGCTPDNGATFTGFQKQPYPINEGVTIPAGGTNVLSIWRSYKALTGGTTCQTGTPGTLPGCGTFDIFASTNSGASWTNSFSSIGASASGTTWDLVGPDVYCASATQCLLFWGQRRTSGATFGSQWAASFNPQTVMTEPTAFGMPQQIAGETALNDCCYISADRMANGKLLIMWYNEFQNQGAKLYYRTATFSEGASSSVSGSVSGGSVQ